MSRILHMIDTAGPGGAETVFVDVVAGSRAKGHVPVALIPGEDWAADALRERGITPIFDSSAGSFDVRYLARLVRLIRERRIDLVHAHLLTSGVYGSVAAKLCGIPAIVTFHGLTDIGRRKRLIATKIRVLNWSASRVAFVSSELRRGFVRLTPLRSDSAIVVHNGIDTKAFSLAPDRSVRAEFGLEDGEALVLSVGNIRPAKGYEVLLESARRVTDRGHRCKFVVVGHPSEPLMSSLLRQRAQLGLDAIVHFTGFRSDVPRLLSSADAFLLTSHSEGFSLATVQALAAGVPVVSTKCGGPEEILRHRTSGLLVNVNAAEEVADAVGYILQDGELRARLRTEGRASVRSAFTQESMINRYHHEYELMASSQRQPLVTMASVERSS